MNNFKPFFLITIFLVSIFCSNLFGQAKFSEDRSRFSADLKSVTDTYPLFVPYRLAVLIKNQGKNGVLAREFLPDLSELDQDFNRAGLLDPIGDKAFHKAPQLIHRYPSRALFNPTSVCPVHCRYCFRKNELNQKDELFHSQFEETLDYLRSHPEISEIIFTGGDPFTLSNEKILFYLKAFAKISSIKDIRFHSRYPVIMPERFDEGLLSILTESSSSFRTLSLAIHINHASEVDDLARATIKTLSALPVQLLSQTVLLKGVNDEASTLMELYQLLIELKVRPYYLHHPDRVKGGMHFYLPLEQGRRIYASLRSQLPGWALPQYVIDLPGGEGKISAFNPETWAYSGSFLNLQGQSTPVKEPDFFI